MQQHPSLKTFGTFPVAPNRPIRDMRRARPPEGTGLLRAARDARLQALLRQAVGRHLPGRCCGQMYLKTLLSVQYSTLFDPSQRRHQWKTVTDTLTMEYQDYRTNQKTGSVIATQSKTATPSVARVTRSLD